MTYREQLIQAFKKIDIDALEDLLDDNKVYMEVSKSTFIKAFRKEFEEEKEYGLTEYDFVEVVSSNAYEKPGKVYKFRKKGFATLMLFFEELDGEIADIYLHYVTLEPYPQEPTFYFKFYEDEKVNFVPTTEYLINLAEMEQKLQEIEALVSQGEVSIDDLISWHIRIQNLAERLGFCVLSDRMFISDIQERNESYSMFISHPQHKAYFKIFYLYSHITDLRYSYENNHFGKREMDEFNRIGQDDEKSKVAWLLKYDRGKIHLVFASNLKKWEETGYIIFDSEPKVVVDGIGILDYYIFSNTYIELYEEIMEKYRPTKEHFDQHPVSGITWNLKTYLKLHQVYLDLL